MIASLWASLAAMVGVSCSRRPEPKDTFPAPTGTRESGPSSESGIGTDTVEETEKPGPLAFRQVSCGHAHGCGVTVDDQVLCWGAEELGRLDVPTGKHFASVDAGGAETCGVTSDGSVACWGWDAWGFEEVGQGDPPPYRFVQVSVDDVHACGITEGHAVVCWGAETGSYPPYYFPYPKNEPGFVAVGTGYELTCMLGEQGHVQCQGHCAAGSCAAPQGQFAQLAVGLYESCVIDALGSVDCWSDATGNLRGIPEGQFRSVSVGLSQACGILDDGSLACWGSRTLTPPAGSDYVQVSTGVDFACAVTGSGEVKCWGNNNYGQSDPPPSGTK